MRLYRVAPETWLVMQGHCLAEGDLVSLCPAGQRACRNLILIGSLVPVNETQGVSLEEILQPVLCPSFPALPETDRTSQDGPEMILR